MHIPSPAIVLTLLLATLVVTSPVPTGDNHDPAATSNPTKHIPQNANHILPRSPIPAPGKRPGGPGGKGPKPPRPPPPPAPRTQYYATPQWAGPSLPRPPIAVLPPVGGVPAGKWAVSGRPKPGRPSPPSPPRPKSPRRN